MCFLLACLLPIADAAPRSQMDFYSAYIVTMLLPAGAVILCASMW